MDSDKSRTGKNVGVLGILPLFTLTACTLRQVVHKAVVTVLFLVTKSYTKQTTQTPTYLTPTKRFFTAPILFEKLSKAEWHPFLLIYRCEVCNALCLIDCNYKLTTTIQWNQQLKSCCFIHQCNTPMQYSAEGFLSFSIKSINKSSRRSIIDYYTYFTTRPVLRLASLRIQCI